MDTYERTLQRQLIEATKRAETAEMTTRLFGEQIRSLTQQLAAVTAVRDTAQATLQRLSDATAIRWLDGYPDGLEARVARLVEYTAETKMHSLEAFEELRAERDALKSAAKWVLNVASGVGKSGGPPSHDEYVNALDALKAVLDGPQ